MCRQEFNRPRFRHFNGFKPQGGFGAIERDYGPVAALMGNEITMGPDIDRTNTPTATAQELADAAMAVHKAFSSCKGVKLCGTISGGHSPEDLEKFNALKRVAGYGRGAAATCDRGV
jgi:hypothetical protein